MDTNMMLQKQQIQSQQLPMVQQQQTQQLQLQQQSNIGAFFQTCKVNKMYKENLEKNYATFFLLLFFSH